MKKRKRSRKAHKKKKGGALKMANVDRLHIGKHYFYTRNDDTFIFDGIFKGYQQQQHSTLLKFSNWHAAHAGGGRLERDNYDEHKNRINEIWTLDLPSELNTNISKYLGGRKRKTKRKTKRKRKRKRKSRRKKRL